MFNRVRRISFFVLLISLFFTSCVTVKRVYHIPNEMGLPYIDLSRDTSRQHIVSRKTNVYMGHPTTLLIQDAAGLETVLAAYPEGGHAKGQVRIIKTTDGGITWENIPSAERLGYIREVPTIHRLEDANGKERLILFSGAFPCRVSVSEDKGKTWSPLKPVGNWGGIVTMSDLIPVKNQATDTGFAPGKYLAFFHDDGRFIDGSGKRTAPTTYTLYKTVTEDGGLNWSLPEMIRQDTVLYLCEPGLVRSPDGRELAMLLRENSRKNYSQVIFSTDEGKTWTEPRPLPAALTGDRHVLRYHTDGRLVAVFRDYQPAKSSGPSDGDYTAWVGSYEDIKLGRPGQYRIRLLENYAGFDAGYSGLELLQDGSFLATTYVQYKVYDSGHNSVIAVKFNLKKTDKLSKAR